ncbi:MAG: bifunctional oligoribonuclease/PAP phosphatase NrnA [Bacteroidaceae bacterium]|nr:bifunctional oligoribonuclease/PAP phosphatase NrnA [Bacteroidaceae bacterium]
MFKNVLTATDVREFKIWMEWADRFVILTHIGPDGDAIGSSLALCALLRGRGKNAVVITPDHAPDFLSWLPGFNDIVVYDDDPKTCDDLIYQADVLCGLDFNTVSRIDRAAASFVYSKARKIMLDHHPFPGTNFDVVISHPELSSASELLFNFICAIGLFKSITTDIATCIYTGIMTDTGGFSYSSSDPNLFVIVSRLLETGVDKDAAYAHVFHSYTQSRLRLQGFALNEKMQIFEDCSTALITLSADEMQRYECRKGDTEGLVNMPLQIQGIKMSVFLREDPERKLIRLSARSVGAVPCNRFASDFYGGGGHLNAAGAEFKGTLKQAVKRFMDGLKQWKSSDDAEIRELFVNKR